VREEEKHARAIRRGKGQNPQIDFTVER